MAIPTFLADPAAPGDLPARTPFTIVRIEGASAAEPVYIVRSWAGIETCAIPEWLK